MLVNSSPISTVDASSAAWGSVPAGPLPAVRSVKSPDASVAFQMLPVRPSSAFGLTKVAIGIWKMVRRFAIVEQRRRQSAFGDGDTGKSAEARAVLGDEDGRELGPELGHAVGLQDGAEVEGHLLGVGRRVIHVGSAVGEGLYLQFLDVEGGRQAAGVEDDGIVLVDGQAAVFSLKGLAKPAVGNDGKSRTASGPPRYRCNPIRSQPHRRPPGPDDPRSHPD